MFEIPLNEHCNSNVTLDTAHALHFRLAPAVPWRSIVVWRDGPRLLRPEEKKPLRDLRPGDEVICQGKRETVFAVEIYR